jgi:hypothetical protein
LILRVTCFNPRVTGKAHTGYITPSALSSFLVAEWGLEPKSLSTPVGLDTIMAEIAQVLRSWELGEAQMGGKGHWCSVFVFPSTLQGKDAWTG